MANNDMKDKSAAMTNIMENKGEIIYQTTVNMVEHILSNQQSFIPANLTSNILEQIKSQFLLHNTVCDKAAKWKIMDELLPQQVAWILGTLYPICLVEMIEDSDDETERVLGLYHAEGEYKGLYRIAEEQFECLARQFHRTISTKGLKEMLACLKDYVPLKKQCKAKNLIAVNNGIFDYDTKQLLPFTPDLVFLSKSKVNYVSNPINPVIHNNEDGADWDVVSWMSELSDDPEIVELLWKILGAIIRPNVPWDKTAWLYSESGNNGKGTLCELMRALCGKKSYASIALSDFGKDFYLSQLLNASRE